MQLELPLAITPMAAPEGTLRYIRLDREIVRYRFRRARRRSIGIVIDDDGLRVAAPGHTPIAEVEALSWRRRSGAEGSCPSGARAQAPVVNGAMARRSPFWGRR